MITIKKKKSNFHDLATLSFQEGVLTLLDNYPWPCLPAHRCASWHLHCRICRKSSMASCWLDCLQETPQSYGIVVFMLVEVSSQRQGLLGRCGTASCNVYPILCLYAMKVQVWGPGMNSDFGICIQKAVFFLFPLSSLLQHQKIQSTGLYYLVFLKAQLVLSTQIWNTGRGNTRMNSQMLSARKLLFFSIRVPQKNLEVLFYPICYFTVVPVILITFISTQRRMVYQLYVLFKIGSD